MGSGPPGPRREHTALLAEDHKPLLYVSVRWIATFSRRPRVRASPSRHEPGPRFVRGRRRLPKQSAPPRRRLVLRFGRSCLMPRFAGSQSVDLFARVFDGVGAAPRASLGAAGPFSQFQLGVAERVIRPGKRPAAAAGARAVHRRIERAFAAPRRWVPSRCPGSAGRSAVRHRRRALLRRRDTTGRYAPTNQPGSALALRWCE